MKPLRTVPRKAQNWLGQGIRRQLVLFVVALCLVLMLSIWLLGVLNMERAYNRAIERDLRRTLERIERLIDDAARDGIPFATPQENAYGPTTYTLSSAMRQRLQNAVDEGRIDLEGACLEISDWSYRALLVQDNLAPRCLMHPVHGVIFAGDAPALVPYENATYERDSGTAVLLRMQCFEEGSVDEVLEGGQRVIGQLVLGGQYAVILSADLASIPKAGAVLRDLMLPVLLVVLVGGIVAATVFAGVITRPIRRLSSAARQMAAGNYEVQVEDTGDDEVGELSRDFNLMAQEVQRSAELQRELVANISHDLRTPLTLIKGYAETVRDLTGDDPTERTHQLDVIIDETDRLSGMVNSVMTYSRMRAGSDKPVLAPVDISALCADIGQRYAGICEQEGANLALEIEPDCRILADERHMERVIYNLLGNALQHIGVDGYLGLSVQKKDGQALVQVCDHGPGILPEDLPHLFDRYYRSRDDAGRPGTGLGLAITQAVMEAHDFAFGVDSERGAGACFWFAAPLLPETD